MQTTPADILEAVKWLVGAVAGIMAFTMAIVWRAGVKSGGIEQQLGLLAQIKERTDRIPQIETTTAMMYEQHRKLYSAFPRAVQSFDRRLTKLETLADIQPTGKYTIPPDLTGKE